MTSPSQTSRATTPSVSIAEFLRVSGMLVVFCGLLTFLTARTAGPAPAPEQLTRPIGAVMALTAVVWLLMVGVRNWTVLRGVTRVDYYRDYQTSAPPEWVERPARAFNNLLQVPVLFYVVCLLMLVTRRLDQAQLALAWTFVALRVLHALIYIGWNYVPYRFAAWAAGCITLGVICVRFFTST